MTKKKPKITDMHFELKGGVSPNPRDTLKLVFGEDPLPAIPKFSFWQQLKAYFTL